MGMLMHKSEPFNIGRVIPLSRAENKMFSSLSISERGKSEVYIYAFDIEVGRKFHIWAIFNHIFKPGGCIFFFLKKIRSLSFTNINAGFFANTTGKLVFPLNHVLDKERVRYFWSHSK